MPDTGYSSPFPTSHDTVGASTIATPLFMPSSPPPPDNAAAQSPDRAKSPVSDRVATESDAHLQKDGSPGSSRSASPDLSDYDLDARLADYTIDFSNFPSAQFGLDAKDEEPLPDVKLPEEQDNLSDVGGPEDFTANMEKYFFGEDSPSKEPKNTDQIDDAPLPTSKLHQSTLEDDAELGEYSEFGPPVDMSTPSHLLHRNSKLSKDATHLEGIEEGPTDDEDEPKTPSGRRQNNASGKHAEEMNNGLRQQIADLQHAVQDRDGQLEKAHRRVLEAASAGEQIKHLQTELQRSTALLDEFRTSRSDEARLREQVEMLQNQNNEKDRFLQRSSLHSTEIGVLQKQIGDMQQELRNRNTHTDLDAERLETISHLRQQLDRVQDRQRERDTILDETVAKLREVTAAKELQLREKNTEVDELKAQVDHQHLEIEKLDLDVDRANKEYQDLEDRIASVEARNGPLEERNSTLEADLTRAQSRVTVHENAIKAMAGDLPNETGGNTLTEIMELIKDLGPSDTADTPPKSKDPREHEVALLRQEITKLQAEVKDLALAKKTVDAELKHSQEQAAETGVLINSIEGENNRLTDQVDSLKSNLDKVQVELGRMREEHTNAQGALERLKEKKTQQPSPPPSPPNAHTLGQKQATLEKNHQAQLESLQSAHDTAVANMRLCLTKTAREQRDRLAAAEKRESDLKAELEYLRSSTASQGTSLQAHIDEVERLESVIASKDESARILDQHLARSAVKQEKEWHRRIDLLLKERDQMAKALMLSWGETEVGDVKENLDEHGRRVKQAYRYKYAPKNGGKKV